MYPILRAKNQFNRTLAIMAMFSFVINMLMLTMPLYMLQIYDRILPSRSTDTLVFLSIIAVAALLLLGLLEIVRIVIASRAAAQLDTTLGATALQATIVRGRSTQGDIQPMRDLATIRGLVSSRALFALLDLPFAPIFIGLLYMLHPDLFWLTLLGAVVLAVVAILNQWTTAASTARSGQKSITALASAEAFARNSETLLAMGMLKNSTAIWGNTNADALIAQDESGRRSAVFTGLSRTIRTGLQIAVLGYGAYLVLAGKMSAGMIFAATIISGRGLQPIDQVIGNWRQYVNGWACWQRLQKSLDSLPPEPEQTKMPEVVGNVSVEGLIVLAPGQAPDRAILKRVSFLVKAGEVLAIVGPSGAGKSTIARLLVGALSPQGGTIRLDGVDISNWRRADLGRQIGYLSQEVELLPATVAQNIARLGSWRQFRNGARGGSKSRCSPVDPAAAGQL